MGRKTILALVALFFLDTFLPWNTIGECPACVSAHGWHGLGSVAGVLALAFLAWEAGTASWRQANIRAPAALVGLGLVSGVVVFAIIRAALDPSFAAIGAWAGVILALAMTGAVVLRLQRAAAPRRPPGR